MNAKLPHLVVVESVDGVGKTTLAKKLRDAFGYGYLYPVPNPFAKIRQEVEDLSDMEARFWYYLGSNVALQRELKGLIASGAHIVLDRYVYSTVASHHAMGATVGCVNLSQVPFMTPDVAILLTCATEVRNERIRRRGSESEEYIRRESPILDETERLLLKYPLQVIDTTFLNEDQVFAATRDLLFADRRKS